MEDRNRIKGIIDGGKFVMFFTHKGSIYGTDEPQRVSYASMKNPDEEGAPEGFAGIDLIAFTNGSKDQKGFEKKDLDDIKVISDIEQVVSMVDKKNTSNKEKDPDITYIIDKDGDDNEARPDLQEK